MNALRKLVLAATGLILSAGGLAVAARDAPSAGTRAVVHRVSQRAAELSMDQAVSLVEHKYRARVVRAETQTRGDRTIYILRMLDDAGRVFSVRVDAASGTIL
jgi:uncharacterized membrane protein YkoI